MRTALLDSYFKTNSLVKQQLDSYNRFVELGMRQVVDRVGKIETNVEGFELRLGKIRVEPPRFYEVKGGYRQISPTEARLRNITYAAPVFLEIVPLFNGIERPTYSDVFIGEIPVMVKSKLCYLAHMTPEELIEAGEDADDPGGYFIINGSERVLVGIEDLVPNKIMTTEETSGTVAKVFSTRHGFRARCVVTRNKDGVMKLEFPATPPDLSFIQILRILGLEKDKDILDAFSSDLIIQNDILLNLENESCKSREEAVQTLSKRISPGQPEEFRLSRLDNLMETYLLPHLGVKKEDRAKKSYYLIRMAQRAIRVANKKLKPDDKDHYANKRVKLAGNLMDELFRYAFQFLTKDIIYQASRADARGRKLQVHTLVRQDTLVDRIRYAMATGNWIAGQTGVSQLLDRTSNLAMMSHLRRVISPLSKKHPHFKARDLHGTHWGKLCPSETPEGPSCSLVKNLAILAQVTKGAPEEDVIELVNKFGLEREWK
ncbi:MAG: DNA-directed RNA polymerase subunit B'' [bacterium]|nr:DNA-directed RNA polymerase subunit B'' [bacterium]